MNVAYWVWEGKPCGMRAKRTPKMRHAWIVQALVLAGLTLSAFIGATPSHGQDFDDDYKKATEGKDVVKNKLYPKDGRIELSGPNAGIILNQSYVNTILVGGGLNYWFSEQWGVGFDFNLGLNSDKSERECIENFYNDPKDEVPEVCGSADNLSGKEKANFGPAYVPIREISNIIMLNALWAPIYGKQLIFLSTTSYFDLYFEFGGGLVMSQYYAKQDTLKNGNTSRPFSYDKTTNEPIDENSKPIKAGASATETYAYGTDGRPDPEPNSNVLLNVTVGQKFHFGGLMHVKLYLRDMLIVGTQTGFENLLSLHVGLGVRF